jgi:Fe-S cluster assembly protein SufD
MDKNISNFKEQFINNHSAFKQGLNGESTPELNQFRENALQTFDELPLPTTKDEEWRYTNILPLLKNDFSMADKVTSISKKLVSNYHFDELHSHQLVFINGHYSTVKSKIEKLPDGVIVGSLSDAIKNYPDIVLKHFGKYADDDHQVFTALSTAFLIDGAFVYVPDGKIVEDPIHIVFITSESDKKIITQPRNLFVAGKNSQLTIIEHYVSDDENIYFTNTVTEVFVDENAVFENIKLQEESKNAFHIAQMDVVQERYSNFRSFSFSKGAAITRNNFNSKFNDESSECTMNGLFLINDEQLFDVHTLIDHAKAHCDSHEHYIGILDDNAKGVFNGKVLVRQDAQKTNAFQKNNNIILSDNALVNTKPQLEIFADDVKCSHGATIGQIDEEAKFYLKSRGISDKFATAMLLNAFASLVISPIKVEFIRKYLEDILSKRFNN